MSKVGNGGNAIQEFEDKYPDKRLPGINKDGGELVIKQEELYENDQDNDKNNNNNEGGGDDEEPDSKRARVRQYLTSPKSRHTGSSEEDKGNIDNNSNDQGGKNDPDTVSVKNEEESTMDVSD
eukprot:CAMPEP_0173159884 /NCGR_PEP_ID=MMETSP1105-20130129/17425_1 /TAXON_ID=2985 /ORGANISM="Ochromonas sp., Strain BG-1" /LENGTH=122 /DNA_ID=CAMNT_0014078503 /DNA_START=339 /DNA_END=707 /DNA_ORIENTATION=+